MRFCNYLKELNIAENKELIIEPISCGGRAIECESYFEQFSIEIILYSRHFFNVEEIILRK